MLKFRQSNFTKNYHFVGCIRSSLFVTGQGLQCLGRHLREMKVTVDPGSKSTFNMVCECTADMVMHTMMLSVVSLFLVGIVAAVSLELWLVPEFASNTGIASKEVGSSVGTPVGTPVGIPVGIVLAFFCIWT
jgi:hypothetical protein